jgi:hypothetical protein
MSIEDLNKALDLLTNGQEADPKMISESLRLVIQHLLTKEQTMGSEVHTNVRQRGNETRPGPD